MTYYILNESIFLIINGESKTIYLGDPLFDQIKDLLLENNFQKVEQIINDSHVNELNLTVKDGSYYFKDIQIPSFITIYCKTNPKKGSALLNFWLNIKNKHSDEIVYSVCQELIKRDFFPLSEDGFFVGYDEGRLDYLKESSLSNKSNDRQVFFYNIHALPSSLYSLIKDNSFEKVVTTLFSSQSKKLLSILKKHCFPKNSDHLEYDFLIYAYALTNVLNEENVIKFLEKATLPDMTISTANELNKFLKEMSLEKDGITINQKKALNFLNTVNWNQINLFVELYDIFKHNLNLGVKDIDLKNDFLVIFEHLKQECSKFNNTKIITLDIKENFPRFYELNNLELGNHFSIVFPENNLDLIEWSNRMGNCIHGYVASIKNGESVVFALINKNTGQMMYNVEVVKGRIKQFERTKKTRPEESIVEAVTSLLIAKGLVYHT